MNAHSSPRRRRLVGAAALATVGVLAALSVPTSSALAAEGDTTIDLYNVNDFHGRIARSVSTPPRDGDAGGAAVLAGALNALRGTTEAERASSAFVSSGDNIGGSTFESFIQQDQPTIDVLNQMDLSVSAIGNHELDKGQDDLRDRVIGPDDARNAEWDYVSANILDAETGEPAFDAYKIETINGKRVGFIGATVDLVTQGLVNPDGIAGLKMGDITTEVNKVAKQLKDSNAADVLVLLVHDGAESSAATDLDADTPFADAVHNVTPDVSAILSAHTHQTYVHSVVPNGGTTPRPVIQTGSYGYNLGHVQLTVAADGSVTPTKAENLPLVGTTYTPDAAVQSTVDAAVAKADVQGAVTLGSVDKALKRAVQSNASENRGGESTLGNFVAEVQREATTRQGSQIAFMNPGGLRADIAAGAVTYKQAAAVQPFANTLVLLDLTGAQIRQALEQQWQPDGAQRPFLKLGASDGFAYTYDPLAPRGQHVTSMSLDGEAIADTTTYKVTVNSFLAGGGDAFGAFKAAAVKQDSGMVDLEAQVQYFQADTDRTVAEDQRSIGVRVEGAPAGGFQPGDTVTLRLSSLAFSSVTDQPRTVSIGVGDQVLATAPIDPTVVDGTDEQGTATLTFRVPEASTSTASPVTALGRATATTTLAAAAAPAATTQEPLVVTLGGQSITLAVTIPVAAADAGTPTPDPTPGAGDPGTGGPGAGTPAGSTPGADEVGVDVDGDGTVDGTVPVDASGELAFTGADVAAPAMAAGGLLLAGLVALLVVRRRRATDATEVAAD